MLDHEKIRKIRKTLGYKSREKFAEKLGIPFPTLRAYEQGIIENIPHSFIATLTDKFNINMNWLMFGEGEMFIKNDNKTNTFTNTTVAGNGSIFDNSKRKTITSNPDYADTHIPVYIIDELNLLFSRAVQKNKIDDVNTALEDFIHEQKKLLR
ncbi:MAG: helix-turn-helix transcriptional regulator [Campylobacterales bacterium]|nr:helix-turn-helix transcriptional regulator [Campylobacterales bacterium]